jgi:methionine sulfoxide reductase catalytic subunit
MLIRRAPDVRPSEITPQSVYLARRQLLRGAAALVTGASVLAGCSQEAVRSGAAAADTPPRRKLTYAKGPFSTDEKLTSLKAITTYNNFYEFGVDKEDPARYAGSLKTRPWSIAVEGEVAKPAVLAYEDFVRPHPLEERVYRLRCVEAWSMVVPWIGFPLAAVLKRFEPTSRAKYVAFETLLDPQQMPGQRRGYLDWPYREGLRIDEAMHPLAILAVGLYGEELPNQNGAPIRLVVPWKYGFKSIKSIVKIRLQEQEPKTAWNMSQPGEYGFYSNVNPEVDHPRWSQAKERRIGEFLRRPTLPFNGYADQVAGLYAGMDLRKFY